jgi:predicted N-formylglutamate amidohydrolase
LGDPPAVTVVNAGGASSVVLVCEHASNHIPARYNGLGLPQAELERHIAWDIGAADLARRLSVLLDAPLFLAGYSRLLIDCNRPLGSSTSIPMRSEDTVIPGNLDLDVQEIARRQAAWFTPFQDCIARHLDARVPASRPSIIIGVHSFTPVFQGVARPWQAGVLYAQAMALGTGLIAQLRAQGDLTVGDNQPYCIEPEHDHTVPVHGDARGIPAVLIEVRQDVLAIPADIAGWAIRLAGALKAVAADV